MQDSIRIAATNQILYEVSRPVEHKSHFFSSSSSENPGIRIVNSQTGLLLATVNAHKASQTVDFTITVVGIPIEGGWAPIMTGANLSAFGYLIWEVFWSMRKHLSDTDPSPNGDHRG